MNLSFQMNVNYVTSLQPNEKRLVEANVGKRRLKLTVRALIAQIFDFKMADLGQKGAKCTGSSH